MFENLILPALVMQIFVLINPLSSFPVLLAAYKQKLDVKVIAAKASVVAFVIALCVILFGPVLFNLYGISIDSFRIAGGAVLFLLGIDTVRAKSEPKEVGEIDGLISIIAMPLLTGPATISFLTIKSYELGQAGLILNTTGAFMIAGTIFYLFAMLIPRINPKVVEISSKVLGLFLTSMAIEMMAKGLTALLFTHATA